MDENLADDLPAQLVENLVARNALRSAAVAQAFLAVPRHLFVPEVPLDEAYAADRAIPTHFDQRGISISSSSAPSIMAIMLEMLSVTPGLRVLEIGAGTGYNAALLNHLVGEAGTVTSIDIDERVAREASKHLAAVGAHGVEVLCRDGWLGEGRKGPFDRIIATVECWDISPHWLSQLHDGGLLVLPLALGPGLTMAVAFVKTGETLKSRSMAYCGFMPLRGPHAGPESRTVVTRREAKAPRRLKETRWLAVYDQATPERSGALRALLAGGTTRTVAAPPLMAGWNVRLVLEEPDPIYLFEIEAKTMRNAVGLFDFDRGSLALIEDDVITSFGQDACLERIAARLDSAQPLDLRTLQITATPSGRSPSHTGDVVVHRPSCDLTIEHIGSRTRSPSGPAGGLMASPHRFLEPRRPSRGLDR